MSLMASRLGVPLAAVGLLLGCVDTPPGAAHVHELHEKMVVTFTTTSQRDSEPSTITWQLGSSRTVPDALWARGRVVPFQDNLMTHGRWYLSEDGGVILVNPCQGADCRVSVASFWDVLHFGYGIGYPEVAQRPGESREVSTDVVFESVLTKVSTSDDGSLTIEGRPPPQGPGAKYSLRMSPLGTFHYASGAWIPRSAHILRPGVSGSQAFEDDVALTGVTMAAGAPVFKANATRSPNPGWTFANWTGVWPTALDYDVPAFRSNPREYYEYATRNDPSLDQYLETHKDAGLCWFKLRRGGGATGGAPPIYSEVSRDFILDFRLCAPGGPSYLAHVRLTLRNSTIDGETRSFKMDSSMQENCERNCRIPSGASIMSLEAACDWASAMFREADGAVIGHLELLTDGSRVLLQPIGHWETQSFGEVPGLTIDLERGVLTSANLPLGVIEAHFGNE